MYKLILVTLAVTAVSGFQVKQLDNDLQELITDLYELKSSNEVQ